MTFHSMELQQNQKYVSLIDSVLNNSTSYINLKSILTNFQHLQFYITGGAIRNLILESDKKINDFDIFINIKNSNDTDLIKIESKLKNYGKLEYGQYGSPRWHPFNEKNIYYDIVPFSNFKVGFAQPKTIIETLGQFDFTANAVAFNIFTKELHDPLGGISDILNKTLKAVRLDYPDSVVSNQLPISRLTILWFRFIHYASYLNFNIEANTLTWLKINSYRKKDIGKFNYYFFKPFISERIKSLIQF